ncbi:MAG: murein biosynthesis integral membrane protein MurJ [Proteobacteria bacterium]|nr:murein biosynthesis integral membrane protein MurJ [Pseudomonadota bacterium]
MIQPILAKIKAVASLRFSLGTLLSRVSGLVREIILARTFGGSVMLDAFYVAYRLPHLFRDMLAEGALGSSFTKIYSQTSELSQLKARELALNALLLTLIITSLLTAIGVIFRGPFVTLMTYYGNDLNELQTTTENLVVFLFPLMTLSSLSAIVSGILAKRKKFFLISLSPIACNVGTVVGVLFIKQLFTPGDVFNTSTNLEPILLGLALGTLLGALLQLWLLSAPLLKEHIQAISSLSWQKLLAKQGAHFKVIQESLPMMMAASVTQLQIIITTNFATSLSAGAVTWLNLAFRLCQLPVGLFAVAEAMVMLPTLASQIVRPSANHQRSLCDSLIFVFWLMSFCMVVTVISSTDLITLLFFGGSFSSHDNHMTSMALKAFGFGILGYGLTKVLIADFYAKERTKIAMYLACAILVLSTGLNLLLLDRFGHIALAGVTSATITLQGIILGWIGLKHETTASKNNLKKHALLALLATCLSLLLSPMISPLLSTLFSASAEHMPLMKLFALLKVIITSLWVASIFMLCFYLAHRRQKITLIK